jgi:hypothetical protein
VHEFNARTQAGHQPATGTTVSEGFESNVGDWRAVNGDLGFMHDPLLDKKVQAQSLLEHQDKEKGEPTSALSPPPTLDKMPLRRLPFYLASSRPRPSSSRAASTCRPASAPRLGLAPAADLSPRKVGGALCTYGRIPQGSIREKQGGEYRKSGAMGSLARQARPRIDPTQRLPLPILRKGIDSEARVRAGLCSHMNRPQ